MVFMHFLIKVTVRAFFMHKRIREFPITGEASTCAESIFDDKLKKVGLELLQSLRWHRSRHGRI